MGAIANLHASLSWDFDDFQRGTRTIKDAFNGIINLAGKVADAVANAGRRMTIGMTLPLTGLGVLFTKSAADAAELQSAFDYTFGAMAGRMNKWAEETGDAMGRATQEMQEGALKFGQLFKSAAPTEAAAARLSQRFTELAQDAASFFNTDFDTAMGKIRSGLSGESEPLRDFGVFLTEAAVKAKAVEMGLIDAGQEVNEYGKIMARAALISEGLADAQGDVERTSGSLANQVRKIKGDLQELATEIGQILEPYARALAATVERLVAWFKDLPEGTKKAMVGFAVFLAALGPLTMALSSLAVFLLPAVILSFSKFAPVLRPLLVAISAIVSPIGTLIVMAGKFVSSFGGIAAIFTRIIPLFARFLGPIGLVITALQLFGGSILRGLQAFAGFVSDAIGDGLRTLFASLGGSVGRVTEALEAFMQTPLGQFLVDAVEFVGMLLEAFITLAGYLTGKLISAVFEVLTFIADWIGGMVETTTKLLTGDWAGAWDAAVQTVGRAIIRIGEWIENLWPWLGGMIQALGEITGAELSVPKVKTGNAWADAPVTKGKTGNAWADAPVTEPKGNRDYAMPDKPKAVRAPRGTRARTSRVRSGPTEEELRARREAIELEQQLAVAREANDIAEIRRLERLRALRDRIQQYERAGLKEADAKIAAEKDMVELAEARTRAMEDYLRERRLDTEYQIAEINNDHEHLRYLDDELELQRRIDELMREGYLLAAAESLAQAEMLQIEQARADAIARRLQDQERAHQLELARLRGDSESSIRAREEEFRIGDRVEDLMSGGEMSRADAEAQAMREAAERSQAHLQGTFRDAFKGGLQAALDGNLSSFFKNWLKQSMFDALSNVLNRLADSLANLFAGLSNGSGGGGFFGAVGSIFGAGSGGGNVPKFASGGGGVLKGYPGIDTNLLSLNGNPIAKVSSGELLNVRPANDFDDGRRVITSESLRSGTSVTQNFYGETADGFRRNQRQINREMRRRLDF